MSDAARTSITILSRRDAEARAYFESEAVISITDPVSPGFPGGPSPCFHGTPHALWLKFDDGGDFLITHKKKYRAEWGRDPFLLTRAAASAVIAFARAHAEDGRDLIVHCEAGISRSAGMAEALDLILNGSVSCIHNHHRPNALVKVTMLRAAGLVPGDGCVA